MNDDNGKECDKEIYLKWSDWVEHAKKNGFDPREANVDIVTIKGGLQIKYICLDAPPEG